MESVFRPLCTSLVSPYYPSPQAEGVSLLVVAKVANVFTAVNYGVRQGKGVRDGGIPKAASAT